jgi:hypothetical protein
MSTINANTQVTIVANKVLEATLNIIVVFFEQKLLQNVILCKRTFKLLKNRVTINYGGQRKFCHCSKQTNIVVIEFISFRRDARPCVSTVHRTFSKNHTWFAQKPRVVLPETTRDFT